MLNAFKLLGFVRVGLCLQARSDQGTRLPSLSVVRLMGIKAGDRVNDAIIQTACQRLQSTGLIKSIDYTYSVYPDDPRVHLTLTVVDESPLVPDSIGPKANADALWTALKQLDPIFTEELPPDEKALTFYSNNLTSCFKRAGRADEYAAAKPVGKVGETPVAVVFEIKKYRGRAGSGN